MTERMTDEEFERLWGYYDENGRWSRAHPSVQEAEARRAREAEEHHWKQVEMLQADLNAAMPMLAALEKESEARWHAAGCAGSPHVDGVEREMCDCAVGTVARARIATLTARVEQLEKLPLSFEERVLKELATLKGAVDALNSTPRAAISPHALTLAQTAVRLGCTKRTVFELLKAHRLVRAPRVGRQARVTVASIEALEVGTKSALPPRSRRGMEAPRPFNAEEEMAKVGKPRK